jgi:hypothetical protein
MSLSRMIALAAVLALPGPLAAQQDGKAQPDRLPLGTVATGATAEASFLVYFDGNSTKGLEAKVEAPPFVKVLRTGLGTRDFGMAGTSIYCEADLAFDTAKAGDFRGEIRVAVGKHKATVPVSVTVRPRAPDRPRVLVADTPFQKYSTGDASVFDAWHGVVRDGGFDADYLLVDEKRPVLRDLDLSAYQAVLLGEIGVVHLREQDVARLKQYVAGGGRVVVSADQFFRGTVAGANKVLEPHGLAMKDEEKGRGVEVAGPDFAADPLTAGVKSLKFFRGSPVAVTDPAKGKVLVASPEYPGHGFVAVARVGKGEVIALGQSLWWNWIGGEHTRGADNARLLRNLLTRAKPA